MNSKSNDCVVRFCHKSHKMHFLLNKTNDKIGKAMVRNVNPLKLSYNLAVTCNSFRNVRRSARRDGV